MAKEILSVPEEYLVEVTRVIRTGLRYTNVRDAVRENLTNWCDEIEEYLIRSFDQELNQEEQP